MRIERSKLARLLQQPARLVNSKSTIPILDTVRLVAADGKLTATATDLDIEITASAPCDVEQDGEISVCVDAKLLAGIAGKLSDGDVTITVDGATAIVKSGRSRFKLQALPVDDFPTMESGDFATKIDVDLASLVVPAAHAMSNEATRYYLNGVYLHAIGNTLTAVATDGHRMVVHAGGAAPEFEPAILPRKLVDMLPKGEVALSLSRTKARVVAGDTVITSKLIDGTYPDYKRVMPQGNDRIMTVDRDAMLAAVERVSIVSAEKARAVKMNIADGALTLTVNGDSSASEEVKAGLTDGPNAESLTIGFNAAYVADAMRALPPGGVSFALKDGGTPALLTGGGEGLSLVLMPMRVG